ncbi:DUF1045 domain-containing protein [Bordetella pseudohinzii]|uniref:Putative phosphonate metabolism protein n=1 Tax=Bordetella pseudohinzii TaxID=1331258 RepID=A0A0J6C0Z2_9BORD|nr:DUF1045 domain-containing protein [Bordetella pseudohinzii]ANY16933.1 hypothetical protein BBN53_14220 [Bordetella pseudohinzii]KMM24683.1 hypothetical protein L540_05280 [Bordetella pseudohinzii]KXA75852.1 hypothetical protein AW877_18755 [Bordetella pseudohinzii]KXA77512.1 hypothetical protein AW878_15215 [Bordetella pseudohinzii]CUJ07762.1 putative phosphonate metabolism protein [Bordetella pseudohinzii]
MPAAYRYALYLAPAGPWRELGRQWLGRCPDLGQDLPSPAPAAWVRAPRHYGLHATLKAPFRLAAHARPETLDDMARRIARRHRPFELPLALTRLRGFLAWCVPPWARAARQSIDALAASALRGADGLRAPLNEAELARRLAAPLSGAQKAMLTRWGYPYALDTFTFHITLTGSLDARELDQARAELARQSRAWSSQAMPVHALSVYVQPEPGADFLVARHYGFDGACADGAGAAWLSST